MHYAVKIPPSIQVNVTWNDTLYKKGNEIWPHFTFLTNRKITTA